MKKRKIWTQTEINQWNQDNPIGTEVEVIKDDNSSVITKVRSPAWIMGGHSGMVLLENISGGWDLNRVKTREFMESGYDCMKPKRSDYYV